MRLHLRGIVLPDEVERDVWIVDGRISFSPVTDAVTLTSRGWLLPGLVDAHCHIGIEPGGPVPTVARARELAGHDRDAGVLAIRDAGSPIPYSELDDDPAVPRLVRAGRHLAPPKRYLPNIGLEVAEGELVAAATDQARAGNGWIKLVGDWIDRAAGDLGPTFSDATVAAAVAAAHANGAKVAVHTFSESALPGLIAAGVDSIEHGTGLNPELIDEVARRQIALVPTLTNIENFPTFADRGEAKFPRYAEHMRRLHRNFPSVVAAAYDAGVPIYVGTDAGSGVAHGLAAGEIIKLHEVGLTTVDALAAGSWRARHWLGFPGIEDGALADLVCYDTDPRADLRTLYEPRHIILRGNPIR